ncbi:MAG: DoxX family protein, partial [Halobacteriaceae archaeon]
MATEINSTVLGGEDQLVLSTKLTGYWVVFLRLLVGWWFFHAGFHKYMTDAPFTAKWFVSQDGTVVSWAMAPFESGVGLEFINFIIPLGETLIGLGLILGALTRLAAFFGAFLMTFFYFVNQGWDHGFVNGDLFGLVLFITIVAVGAGRIWGLDAY